MKLCLKTNAAGFVEEAWEIPDTSATPSGCILQSLEQYVSWVDKSSLSGLEDSFAHYVVLQDGTPTDIFRGNAVSMMADLEQRKLDSGLDFTCRLGGSTGIVYDTASPATYVDACLAATPDVTVASAEPEASATAQTWSDWLKSLLGWS